MDLGDKASLRQHLMRDTCFSANQQSNHREYTSSQSLPSSSSYSCHCFAATWPASVGGGLGCEYVHFFIYFFIFVAWHIPALTDFMCERDELADLVEDLKHGSVIGSHWRSLTLYKKSFSGEQLLGWLQTEKGLGKWDATTAVAARALCTQPRQFSLESVAKSRLGSFCGRVCARQGCGLQNWTSYVAEEVHGECERQWAAGGKVWRRKRHHGDVI